MNDSTNQQWITKGKKSKHPVYRKFFASAFENKKYSGTKLAVYTRLQHLQNNYSFSMMMNGPSAFDLKKEMQKGKVILFNLSK